MKPQAQGEGGHNLDGLHAADAMAHGGLRKWFDWDWCSPLLQPVPVVQQFLLAQFSPRFDEAPLTRWKRARDHLNRIDADHHDLLLPVGVEMWGVMFSTGLRNIRMMIPKKRLSSGTPQMYASLAGAYS